MTSEQHAEHGDGHRYTAALAAQIEQKWQDQWEERGTFHAATPAGDSLGGPLPADDPRTEAEKFFLLDMFPYPSGKGLHVGHPLGYIATDVVARYQRMKGRNVLHALGYDAFGLPAEQFAVQTGQHPRITTEQNVANMRRQLRRLGLGHDARRSFATTDEDFVRWTQWIFRLIFESWYDPNAPRHDGGTGTARPISELVEEFENGQRDVCVEGDPRTWAEMSEVERARVIDGYRLAYISEAPVNWCPGLGTVLANEEVTADGRSERGNFPVFQRSLRQWMLRITAYGDRLIDDLDTIEWPEKVRSMQRNWIGRSYGANVHFAVGGGSVTDRDGTVLATGVDADAADAFGPLTVFTTRADTLFGATFMVVSPEHPLVTGETSLVPAQWPGGEPEAWTGGAATPREAVAAYQAKAAAKTPEERMDDARAKTGVFSGLYGINPVNGTAVPIFVADYVLMGYGTGAIMAVPAHDQRDFEFATAYALPVVPTLVPAADTLNEDGTLKAASLEDTEVINSVNDEVSLDGLHQAEATERITVWLAGKGLGEPTTTYRLRDWLFSRQRYWGEPFPIVYDEDGLPHSIPEDMLPVSLPEVPDYAPRTFAPDDVTSEPEPPLGRLPEWVSVELDLGDGKGTRRYRRETNTMPQWAGSSWYVLRYLDPKNDASLVDPEVERYWMGPRGEGHSGGADLYVGGVEHAVLHLLYARFWHKVLYDRGHVSSIEPFHELFNQGYIQAYAYADERGQYVLADDVEASTDDAGETTYSFHGEPVIREYGKMGKSLKNIVTPDDMYDAYGADTFRLYEMSMGPLDVSRAWNTRDVVGSQRFLQRLWRNVVDEETGEVTVVDEPASQETRREVATAVDAVRTELDHMRVNTAIAKMIVLNNHLTTLERVPREAIEALVLMVAPAAPHIAEELWERLGHTESLAYAPFPQVEDESLLKQETMTAVVQIKGKVRDKLEVSPDISEDELREMALASEKVQGYLDGEPRKVIVRAPKLVSIVP